MHATECLLAIIVPLNKTFPSVVHQLFLPLGVSALPTAFPACFLSWPREMKLREAKVRVIAQMGHQVSELSLGR